MLVISRKCQEKIQIGPDITIIVGRIHNHHVKILIEAPCDVVVRRSEVADERGKGAA